MTTTSEVSFFSRIWLAFQVFFRVLIDGVFAADVRQLRLSAGDASDAATASLTPASSAHASGLFVLGILQREGRFLDFLQDDASGYSDAELGAGARVVHQGCRKVLKQYLRVAPILAESEGTVVTVPAGYDANRIRLTGNVAGQAPFRGSLKHHGWMTLDVTLPPLPSAGDPRVLAPAEVELP